MKWHRLGHFLPEIPGFTHAALPTFHDGRVFFSPRDSENRSHVYYAHFDPEKLELGYPVALFGPGRTGGFDDSGCSVSQVTDEGVLYMGWNLGVTVPFRNTLAQYHFDGRAREILVQRDEQYLSIHYGWRDRGRFFYGVIFEWPMKSVIVGNPSLMTQDILCRPCVIGDEMWFSYRVPGGEYRIGYARLAGGAWKIESSGLEPSGEGFESRAVTYPCVFDYNGGRYMLYNGDGYGRTGFGLARLEAA